MVRDVTRVALLEADRLHAWYPMIDNMLTLLQANSHVYVDGAGLIWSYRLNEVNRYLSGWWKLDWKSE